MGKRAKEKGMSERVKEGRAGSGEEVGWVRIKDRDGVQGKRGEGRAGKRNSKRGGKRLKEDEMR